LPPSASATGRSKQTVELTLFVLPVQVGDYSFDVLATDKVGTELTVGFSKAKRHAAEDVTFLFDLASGTFTAGDDLATGTLQTGELRTSSRRQSAAPDYGMIDMAFSSTARTRTERIPCGNGAHVTMESRDGTLSGSLHFDSNTDVLWTVDQTALPATLARFTTPKGCAEPGQLGGGACPSVTTLEATGRAGARPLVIDAANFGALGSFLDLTVEQSGPKFDPATIHHHISVVGGPDNTFKVSKSLEVVVTSVRDATLTRTSRR